MRSVVDDPPPASWIKVRFSGAINGVPYSRTVFYGAPTPHMAKVDISDLTTASGPLTITSSAHGGWLGMSPTSKVTITCADPKSKSIVSGAIDISARALRVLPFTGGNQLILIMVAVLFLAAGTYFMRGWRQRSRTD